MVSEKFDTAKLGKSPALYIHGDSLHRTICPDNKIERMAERGLGMSLTIEELKEMQYMNIMELDRSQLVEARDIVIDTTKCVESRIKSFIEQTHNPFAQNVGSYILQIGYREDSLESVDDRMILLTKRKTQITI